MYFSYFQYIIFVDFMYLSTFYLFVSVHQNTHTHKHAHALARIRIHTIPKGCPEVTFTNCQLHMKIKDKS